MAFTNEQKELYRAGVLKLTEGQVEAAKRMAKRKNWSFERSILESVYLIYFGPNIRTDVPRPTDDLATEIVSDIPLPNTADRGFDVSVIDRIERAMRASASPAEIEQIKKILRIDEDGTVHA